MIAGAMGIIDALVSELKEESTEKCQKYYGSLRSNRRSSIWLKYSLHVRKQIGCFITS